MGKFLLGTVALLLFAGAIWLFASNKNGLEFSSGGISIGRATMSFGSQDFKNGGEIPIKFTCDGENAIPPMNIDRTPGDAKSLAVIIEDLDTNPKGFTHWILYNIDPSRQNIEYAKTPEEADSGRNDFGNIGYGGPCPPQSEPHTYHFKIYALDTKLEIAGNATRAELENALEGHVVAQGQFKGTYTNRYASR